MARIGAFTKVERERAHLHEPTECEYSAYELQGARYLQLDTLGSKGRKLKGKVSQSVQLDEAAARELLKILKKAFPDADR